MPLRRLFALLFAVLTLPLGAFAQDHRQPNPVQYLTAGEARPALPSEDLLEVHLINVASADAILLRIGGKTMLVDSGNQSTAGRVLTYLAELGVDRLDYAFATHPHDDHIGGFVEILRQIPANVFLAPPLFGDFSTPMDKALKALLAERRIPVATVFHHAELPFGAATLYFYQWEKESAAVNDRSMILRAALGSRAILLSADLEGNGQRAHASTHGEALRADILKMPHHGIGTYTAEFHGAVAPRLATFSNVQANLEGIISLTERRGVDNWMLTTKGTIVTVTDGKTWTVWQILGPAERFK